MNITIYQLDTIWNNKKANLDKIKNELEKSKETDLFLLPEMFNTGYIMDPVLGAEALDEFTIPLLSSMLTKTNTVVAGTIPAKIEGKYYNSFVFIDKNGLLDYYSKQHLFAPAGEADKYTSDNRDVLITLNTNRIKPLVCYDLRFPYASFNKYEKPYDVLIYSANWPKGRIDQWEKLLLARAIENQCYVVGINRVGIDANGYEYPGHSMVVNFKGEVLLNLGSKEKSASIQLDFEAMNEYRKKFPFLKDRVIL